MARKKDANAAIKKIVSQGVFDRSRKVDGEKKPGEMPVIRSIAGCELVALQKGIRLSTRKSRPLPRLAREDS